MEGGDDGAGITHDRRKIPWRLSKFQKARQRRRLRAVDAVVDTVDRALKGQGVSLRAVDVWKETMPTEAEMLPKDKYTMFDRKVKRYRKGIHSMFCSHAEQDFQRNGMMLIARTELPKWTRVSQRVNPPGY